MKSPTVADVLQERGVRFALDVAGLKEWCAKHGKPMPTSEQLRRDRQFFSNRFLRRNVDPQRAGRPRGSRRPSPPLEVTEKRLAVYIEARLLARRLRADFAEYGGMRYMCREAAAEILQFVEDTRTHRRMVQGFLARPKPDHLLRFCQDSP